MWIFLITEIMFFGGLFLAYTVYRRWYADIFAVASCSLDVYIGAANTVVLLSSSLTMVLAVRAAQLGKRKALVIFLVLTLLLGGVFLGVKAYEWNQKYVEHHIPGPDFHFEGVTQQGPAQLFFSLYFAMTGLHALHMVIGAGLLIVLIVLAAKGRFSASYMTPVDVVGLYWHFVDVIWIFLFPLLYLIDRHLGR
jgi:cytochrome c oxidase subunit 3